MRQFDDSFYARDTPIRPTPLPSPPTPILSTAAPFPSSPSPYSSPSPSASYAHLLQP
eukprot:COSAG06_NODE_66251_length_255_cov_0.089744_1_plen_57_part_00